MGKVRLTRHRAQRGELGRGEARHVVGVGVRVRHALERRLVGALRQLRRLAEDGDRGVFLAHAPYSAAMRDGAGPE